MPIMFILIVYNSTVMFYWASYTRSCWYP